VASEQSISYCTMTLEYLAANFGTPIATGCRFGRSDQLVRYTAQRRGHHDDTMAFCGASRGQLRSLGDSLGSADRSAAEFHHD
jgi:hypothetical protein